MTTPEQVDLDLNLDSSGYVQGAQQAAQANAALSSSYADVQRQAGLMSQVWRAVTPSRAAIGGLTGATAAAASWQSQMQGINARAAVTGANLTKIGAGVQGLARSFGGGTRNAIEITDAIQGMGMASDKQVSKVAALGKEWATLGQATQQNAAVIGRQLTGLNRAYGALDADTKRFRAMSDVVTALPGKVGGNTNEIIGFAKQIAPFARQAGIGETAVLGIGAAFSKAGEDGYAAANGLSKVISDINRSVRDGSSEMSTYADIVGKTRQEFEALFKADPTKAVGLVASAIAAPGAQGQRNAERIGLDGIRAQRAFQQVEASGGLQGAVNSAQEAYGGGATEKAAAAARGVNEEFDKLATASGQLATAFGRPLLGAVEKILALAGGPIRGAAGALNSRVGQAALTYGVPLAAGALGLRALSSLGLNLGVARQLLTTNTLTQGFRQGAMNGGRGGGAFGAIAGIRNPPRGVEGPRGLTAFQRFAFTTGQGYGRARAENADARLAASRAAYMARGMSVMEADQAARVRAATARSPLARVGAAVTGAPRALSNALLLGQQAGRAVLEDSARMVRQPDALQRRSALTTQPGGAFAGLGRMTAEMKAANAAGGSLGQRISVMGTIFARTAAETAKSGTVLSNAGRAATSALAQVGTGLRAFAASARATGTSLAATTGLTGTGGAVKGLGKGLGGLATGLLGSGPQAALLAGGALAFNAFSNYRAGNQRSKDYVQETRDASITGTLDSYRESTGRATDAVQTFAQQVNSANEALGRTVSTFGEAQQVNASDEELATSTKGKVVHRYRGSNADVAEQVRAINPRGLDPQDLQAVKVDLLRQLPRQRVEQVLSSLGNADASVTGGAPQAIDYSKVLKPGSGKDGTSIKTDLGRVFTGRGNDVDVTNAQENAISQVAESISQTSLYNKDNYGAAYAQQEQEKQANEAFAAAQATGNKELMAAVVKSVGTSLNDGNEVRTDGKRYFQLESGKISLSDFLTEDNTSGYRERQQGLGRQMATQTLANGGVGLTGGYQSIAQVRQDSALTQRLDKAGLAATTFGTALTNRTKDMDTALNKTVTAFLRLPSDTNLASKAVRSMTEAVLANGGSMAEVASQAQRIAEAMGSTSSDVAKLTMRIQQQAIGDVQANSGFAGTATTLRLNNTIARNLANSTEPGEQGEANRAQGRQMLQENAEAYRSYLANRLKAQYDFQKQSARGAYDFNLSVGRATEDFQRGVARSDEDYHRQLARQDRDYQIGVKQSTEDFHTSIERATRDFAKTQRRQNEDAAKAMYDPYKRIQAQAVFDIGSLMTNLGEQNQAMRDQANNLRRLRGAGLTNAAIDQLGLNKAENAQQAQLTAEQAVGDPGVAKQLNAAVATRMALGATLNSDASNKDLQRAKDDFAVSLADQDKDFRKSLKRNKEALQRSIKDSREDYNRSMARQAEDFQRQLDRQRTDYNTSLARAQQDLEDSTKEMLGSIEDLQNATYAVLQGKAVDFSNLMKDQISQIVTDVKGAASDITAAAGVGNSSAAGAGGTAQAGQNGGGYGNAGITTTTSISDPARPKVGEGVTTTTYVNPGTGTVLPGSGSGSGASANYKPSADFVRAHPSSAAFNQAIAKRLAPDWAKGDEWSALLALWNKESGWNQYADNTSSSAYGIPQALPGTKMGDKGKDWRTNPATQIAWGLGYIRDRYGDPVNAWSFHKGHNWYAAGGVATSPHVGVVGEAGVPEAMIPLDTRGVAKIADAMAMFLDSTRARSLQTAGYGSKVTYTGNTFVEDHSTKLHVDKMEVVSDDPGAMMRAMEAKARALRLTQAPQTKGRS